MGSQFKEIEFASGGASSAETTDRVHRSCPTRASVFVVEDDELVRDSLEPLLDDAGYDVAFAENGCEALVQLRARPAPDIILFDLAMPAMDGWEFRAIQKNDPLLKHVPAVAMTADGSPKALAISAEAYLRKPFDPQVLLDTIERILLERNRPAPVPAESAEGLTALARLASAVGHEINNPLTIVLLSLGQAIQNLGPSVLALETPLKVPLTDLGADEIRTNLVGIAEILEDGKVGAERIRDTVAKLAHLTRRDHDPPRLVDIHTLIDRSIVRVWNRLSERTHLVKSFGKIPALRGHGAALEHVFVTLLLNAVEAIPADAADWNEIRVVTRVDAGADGPEAVVEILDSGVGLSPEAAARMFEPFFSTKAIGTGHDLGLGLATARQRVLDHGGRITIEPQLTRGALARVSLPIPVAEEATRSSARSMGAGARRQDLKKQS